MPAAAFVATLGLTGTTLFFSLLIAGAIDAYILGSLLAPDAIERDLGSQNLVVKSSSEPHKVIYGRTMVGGCVVFLDVLDRYYLESQRFGQLPDIYEQKNPGTYLNIAIAIAAHEIDGIEEVYFGDELVLRTNVLTGKIEPVSNKYKNYMEFVGYTGSQTAADDFIAANVEKHYNGGGVSNATNEAYYKPQGVTDVTSNTITISSSLVYPTNTPLTYHGEYRDPNEHRDRLYSNGTYNGVADFKPHTSTGHAEPAEGRPWSASHKLTNTAYLYFRLRYHPDLYSGIPQVRTVIRGKRLYDPRWDLDNLTETDQGTWAQNTAYVVDDMVESPSAVKYICIEAHTSINTPWATDANSDGLSDAFKADFIVSNYWRQVQTNLDSSTWEYSDNWALCMRDYLTSGNYHSRSDNKNTLYGVGVKETEIDNANIIEAANVSDEVVYLRPFGLTVTTDSYDSDLEQETVTIAGGDYTDYYVKHEVIEITNASGTYYDYLNGIVTSYYAPQDPSFADVILEKLSRSGTYIEESSYDSGTLTTTIKYRATEDKVPTSIRLYSRRFTVNGMVDTSQSPINILEDLLASGSGKLPFAQGKFLVIPGVYITPTITIGENNLAGPLNIKGSLGSANLINGITGTIRNPANKWEESDFTKQTHPTYVTEDGGYELVQNVVYNFLTSSFDAQRLARISLQRSRENVSATLICNMSVAEIPIGEFINVTLDRVGWVDKVFSVTSWLYQDGKISLGLREENSAAYDWVSTDLTPITYSPATVFDSTPNLDPISNLVLASGTTELRQTADGTIIPRVKVTWTAPDQDFGTYLELWISIVKDQVSEETRIAKVALVEEEVYYLEEVTEGDSVLIIATIKLDDPNVTKNESSISVGSLNHIVVGKLQPPADITNLTSSIKEDLVVLNWDYATPEIDFKDFEIQEGSVWNAFGGNLFTSSEELDGTGWGLTALAVVNDSINAPDGTLTADTLTPANSTDQHRTVQNETIDVTTDYTFSCYFKAGTYTEVSFLMWNVTDGGWGDAGLDLTTGVISSVGPTTTATAEDVGDGWWRFSITSQAPTVATNAFMIYAGTLTSGSYTADGTSYIYGWGAQLEKSSTVNAYTKAVATAILPTVLIDRTASKEYIVTGYTIDTFKYWVKAIDTSEIESVNALSTDIIVSAPNDIVQLNNRINTDVVNIYWNPAIAGTFSIAGYVIREGGANWDVANIVTTVKSTDYDIADTWIGNRTYRVKTIDVYGNLSTEITAVVTTVGPTAVATINNTILAENINIFWGEVAAGSFAIAGYIIKYGGTTFDNANLLAITKATDYTIPDTWVGSRTLRIKSIDVYGNLSAETTTPIIITVPDTPILGTSSIVSDRVEITWSMLGNTGTFPVKSYDIRYDTGEITTAGSFLIGTEYRIESIGGTDFTLIGAISNTVGLIFTATGSGIGAGTATTSVRILITSTDAFSRKVDWLGTRKFWIAPIDSVGNRGSELTSTVGITAPGASVITPQVIDNNVLLSWTDAADTLPVAYYEIRRGAVTDAYAAGVVVGTISSLFVALFETISATYKYWVTGVDTAGNPGTNNVITVQVNEPPDYVLLVSANDDFSTVDTNWLSRTFTNSYVNSLGLLTLPVNLTETWATHFTNNSWVDLEDADTAGFPIYAQPTPATAQYQVVYDHGSILSNLSISATVTDEIIAGNPVLKLTLEASESLNSGTNDTLDATGVTLIDTTASFNSTVTIGNVITNETDGSSGTVTNVVSDTELTMSGGLSSGSDNQWQVSDVYSIWTIFPQVTASTIKVFVASFRYVRLTADIVSAAADIDLLEISNIALTIDIKEKTDSGNGSAVSTHTGAGYLDGTLVTLNKSFVDISSIVVTSNIDSGSANDTIVLYNFEDTANPTGFRVLLYNSSGTRVNGEFSWVARGY